MALPTLPTTYSFQQQTQQPAFAKKEAGANIITVDDGPKYQKIDGFGWALTGGSAGHLQQMSPAARTALIKGIVLRPMPMALVAVISV